MNLFKEGDSVILNQEGSNLIRSLYANSTVLDAFQGILTVTKEFSSLIVYDKNHILKFTQIDKFFSPAIKMEFETVETKII